MKKIINFLFVRRPETSNKWWHRLFTVFLLGSGIVVFALTVFLTVLSYNHTWFTYRPVAFGLEPNYQKVKGKELPCDESISFDDSGNLISVIECKGVNISQADAMQYDALYEEAEKNLQNQFGLDKYNISNCPSSNPGITDGFSSQQITCARESLSEEEADPAYTEYQNSLQNLLHIKVAVENIHFRYMFEDIVVWLFIPILVFILWILFWSTFLYRLVLYIIFGKNK